MAGLSHYFGLEVCTETPHRRFTGAPLILTAREHAQGGGSPELAGGKGADLVWDRVSSTLTPRGEVLRRGNPHSGTEAVLQSLQSNVT